MKYLKAKIPVCACLAADRPGRQIENKNFLGKQCLIIIFAF